MCISKGHGKGEGQRNPMAAENPARLLESSAEWAAGIAAISADIPRNRYEVMLNFQICRIPLNKFAFRVVYKRSAYQDTRRGSNAVP